MGLFGRRKDTNRAYPKRGSKAVTDKRMKNSRLFQRRSSPHAREGGVSYDSFSTPGAEAFNASIPHRKLTDAEKADITRQWEDIIAISGSMSDKEERERLRRKGKL